jgi:hypothetical protein
MSFAKNIKRLPRMARKMSEQFSGDQIPASSHKSPSSKTLTRKGKSK